MRAYPTGGAAIGIMQIVDAAILYVNEGVASPTALALATIEFVWALVSLAVLIRTPHRPTKVLAGAFFAYNVFGWLLAAFAIPQTAPFAIPMWFVVVGGIFGVAYATGAIRVAREP
jgi:hypothetical protein